jgi:DNA-directed RNA polymerase specialized sigma24 family protein
MDASTNDLLRSQDWRRIHAQLAAIAHKRFGKRPGSWPLAQEIAQEAVARAYAHGTGWDPRKAPLMAYLVATTIGLCKNEYRRRRNACEVELDDAVAETAANDDVPIDEQLDNRRYAVRFHDRLVASFASEETEPMCIAVMKEGIVTPRDIAQAIGRPEAEVELALRRIRYRAVQLTREMSAEIERDDERAERAGEREEEVSS